jgi:hypothetical protein
MVHQDGYGTVDSGHTVLEGYNKVILLRRIPEPHKVHAVGIFPSLVEAGSSAKKVLYGLPHANERKSSHEWANADTILDLQAMK